MAEMDTGNEATLDGGRLQSPTSALPDTEDDKERAIARAALSIAELGTAFLEENYSVS